MIDLSEKLLSLADAAKFLPAGRRGRPVSISCLLRWIVVGVRTPSGKVRLEAIRVGSRWLTSSEALERFADRLTPRFDDAPARPRTTAKRRRASERAERELAQNGI